MTVKVQWDTDAEKTGLPDTGTDTKVYTAGQEGGHQVRVTSETDPSRTQLVTFEIPLSDGGGGTITPDKTTVDASGDAAARTITVGGTAFPASTAGTVALHPGAPGSGGTAVVTANATTDAQGAFTGAALVVPAAQAAGDYHIVATFGASVSDNTAITVTGGGTGGTLTADKTEVDSAGDATARTVSVTGAGFTPGAGRISINTGAPGSGGTEVVGADVTAAAGGAIPATPLVVPEGQAAGDYHILTSGAIGVSDNTALTVTATVTGTLTLDKDTVDSAGDEAARTVSVTGASLPANEAGRVSIMTGAPGSGGTEVVGADVTADATGNLAATPLIVPAAQAAGDYHVMGVFSDVTIDDNALTVTSGGGGGTLTADKTEVNSTGDEAARTVSVSGAGFTPGAGRVAINSGAPGSGGTEVVGADVTADAGGAFPATPLIVPEGHTAGDYHILTSGAMGVSDNTALAIVTPTVVATPTTVSLAGDEAARTVTVTGSEFLPNITTGGRAAIMTGAPGSGGTEVVGADVTTDAEGATPDTPLIVPTTATAGPHHITVTDGTNTSDNTALTVTA